MKVFMIATTANSATTATSAITANSATTAISATTANSATTAISATTADKAVKDGDGNNIVSTYLAKTHANASGTTAITSFGHVRIVTGDVSTISAVTNGSAAASFHNHDGKYSTTGYTHNASAITGGTLNIARIPTGTGSTQVALGNHTHKNNFNRYKQILFTWLD